jgi:hypothetical protein
MSNRNPYDGYPGQPYPPPDLTDEAQFAGLGATAQDIQDMNPRRAGRPWGRVVQLGFPQPNNANQLSITAVSTDVFPQPIPFAIRVRFSMTPGGPFTPEVPSSYSGRVTISVIQSLDLKSGSTVETFPNIAAGDAFRQCQFIARSISVTVSIPDLGVDGPPSIFVAVVACPVTMVDCDELTGLQGYTRASVTRFAASTDPQIFLAANPARQQFVICNHSPTATLAVAFGVLAATSPASSYTLLLPPNTQYESPLGGFTGQVSGIWLSDDETGEALVTEGR